MSSTAERIQRSRKEAQHGAIYLTDRVFDLLAAVALGVPDRRSSEGGCGCTIHGDRDEPCPNPARICIPCERECWGIDAHGRLDDAWAAAENALPPEALIRAGRTGMTATGWATAYLHGEHLATAFSNAGIADALLDLARQLTPSTEV